MSSHSLSCAVIGAGIAGLSACIALRRAGHNVELLEKSYFKNEIGAALTTTPNGGNVLDRWEFDGEKAGETIKLQSRRFRPESLEQMGCLNLEGVKQRFGRGIVSMHRVDFHNTLREMALAPELSGSAKLRLGTEVLDVDCKTGTVVLKDGTKLQKDLIVIADGIKVGLDR
ncbi:hypothetical protein AMS68_005262 [Peltaster fructicola]|uniref:FAD/NAD(P)-binding domain-containing protein n=1 Tax=Peltaster fructicola TaxID=286661 RepID=A0A6H0XYK4_9PEZI|nr:hypothetical protein AMS68_005262 [Peltaster fructicola]